ncbi:MAG: ribosomal RNA small subunit methyltransferase A [Elusimicrobia bacterium]|jgi:16S rRNA (adenine1518-N6/adenine1519-N6)-dimethyltransferase|nr:ribosomal RNA small subunit methyltransferase A [Elusimicrobiota bacterium]
MRAPWGQNFLTSSAVARRIAESLLCGREDHVIEIGPGRGALTSPVLSLCGSLTAVELDQELVSVLAQQWGHDPRLTIVSADFMDWPLPPVRDRPVKVVGNLPYSAAAAIVQKVLAWRGWDRAVFMVQKEVADRMRAVPGGKSWGLLGLSVQSRATVRRLFEVPPGAFRPAPKITSTVLELNRLPSPRVKNIDAFFKVAHAAFGQRRKTLSNSLCHGLNKTRTEVDSVLTELSVNPQRRAETVTIEEFDRISEKWGGK